MNIFCLINQNSYDPIWLVLSFYAYVLFYNSRYGITWFYPFYLQWPIMIVPSCTTVSKSEMFMSFLCFFFLSFFLSFGLLSRMYAGMLMCFILARPAQNPRLATVHCLYVPSLLAMCDPVFGVYVCQRPREKPPYDLVISPDDTGRSNPGWSGGKPVFYQLS